MANKPRIRFRGFTEDWEQRKFLDLLDTQNGIRRGPFGSSLKKDSFVKKSDYVVYEQQNAIYDNYVTRYFISKEKYNELIRFNIQPGDFIMSGAGTIGRISMVPDGIKKGVFNQALIRFKVDKNSVNPLYFLKFMQSDMMQKQLTQANPGSAMTNLVPMDELKKWDVTIPSLEEQNKISNFINQIDESITLHQCKLKKLNLAKKSLLQKLFPRNGSQIPGVRFKGFTDAWEQRKLGDLYKRVNERNDGTLGRDKWISVAKMYFQDPDKVQSNNLDTRTYVMKKGDIAFEGHPNNEFKFGRFVINDIGTGIISELFPIYRPITEYDLDFWKYAIQLERVMAPILAKSITSSGNSSNKLDHNHFLNKELLVPNIEEQKKIGTLLSLLSKNITLHQRKLERLQEVKKGLLQKMFV